MDAKRHRGARLIAYMIAAGVVTILLFCGAAAALGVGGLWWANQQSDRADDRRVAEVAVTLGPHEARLQAVRGLVEVQDLAGLWSAGSSERTVDEGQRIRTGVLSGAELVFPDGSRVSLGPDTEISVDELEVLEQGQTRRVALTQVRGESSHTVVSAAADGSSYEVRTPSATGMARGTRFQVAVMPDQAARFSVEEGEVAVTGESETVLVSAGQVSTVNSEEPPSEPALRLSGEGVVTQTGETWTIAGQTFSIHPATVFVGAPDVGDVVLVEGRLLPDATRLADLIVLRRSSPANGFTLTGEVQAIEAEEWTVAGQAVVVGENTEIDRFVAVGEWVRVEGEIVEGALEARTVLLASRAGGMPFAFTGVLQEAGPETWIVSGVEVVLETDTVLEDGLASGDVVRVSGSIQPGGEWLALNITRAAPEAHSFEFTGRLESLSPWQAAGIRFETRNWTMIEPGLRPGDLVRVEGQVEPDGAWLAAEIEKIEEQPVPTLLLTGTVISTDPWVVSGFPLAVDSHTAIRGELYPGMLVRVEIHLLPDSTWQVARIVSLRVFAWAPGCMDLTATVESVEGKRVRLLGWPQLALGNVKVEGELAPGSVVQIRVCVEGEAEIHVVQIVVIGQPETEVELPAAGEKVTICHKPFKKKDGNTLSIAQPALPAHLAHGDRLGACSGER